MNIVYMYNVMYIIHIKYIHMYNNLHAVRVKVQLSWELNLVLITKY